MAEIVELAAAEAEAALPELVALLVDSVDSGGSVGFHAPLDPKEAEAFWRSVLPSVGGSTRLLAARLDGRIVGSAQLQLATRKNGAHRAEVAKVLVHTAARKQGIGAALMATIEAKAREHGRHVLVLDTRTADAAESVYLKGGWTIAGVIPGYVLEADGSLRDTTVMFKRLA